ncbi:transposase [Microtetraspora sp. NBRC 16547]|uniref:transposase n=1 Tax=Microtetraspora sp. NBRC 16547 TaxID=3030993 RepID=UPI00332D4721
MNAVIEAKLAASLQARSVASSAAACSGVGRSLTCTTSFTSNTLSVGSCRRDGNRKPDIRQGRGVVYRSTASTRIRSSLPSSGGGRFWSPSPFAASCGDGPLSIIKEYIENQKRPD